MSLPKSVLVKHQRKQFRKELANGDVLIVEVRHDDDCGNGRNSFAITGELYGKDRRSNEPRVENSKGKGRWLYACGCLHDEVIKYFPKLAPLLKWHLCSTDGPMHYVANTLYHASDKDCFARGVPGPDLEAARRSAIWPDATLEQLQDKAALEARLPALMKEFKRDVESLGLVY